MPTKGGDRDDVLRDGIAAANALIETLCMRDGVDTRRYGLMVRKAGRMSLALHRGLHPSEIAVTEADGRHDPRRPKAEVGLTPGGALQSQLRQAIEARHARLAQLHAWSIGLEGRSPAASDMLWDPVLLALLRMQGADLDRIAASGPTDFANTAGRRDRPSAGLVVDGAEDAIPYIAMVDGNHVRASQIRYAPGVFYAWTRERPEETRLSVARHGLPHTLIGAVIGMPLSRIVGHESLAGATALSCTTVMGDATIRADAGLVSTTGV